MWIEWPISVQVISWEEDQLKINESNLSDRLSDTFLLKIGDIDRYDEFEKAIITKLKDIIANINNWMDKLLDIKSFDRGVIDASDWENEKKILSLISSKINNAIDSFLSSESDITTALITSLDNIWKWVELAKEEQWYYNEFISILKWWKGGFEKLMDYASYTWWDIPNT